MIKIKNFSLVFLFILSIIFVGCSQEENRALSEKFLDDLDKNGNLLIKNKINWVIDLLDSDSDLNVLDEHGESPLMIAVAYTDDVDFTRKLINNGAKLDFPLGRNCLPFIFINSIEELKLFQEYGLDLNSKTCDNTATSGNNGNQTLLGNNMFYIDTYDFIKYLLENGADPNLKTGSSYPLLEIGDIKHNSTIDKVKLLLEFGADPNVKSIDNTTLLHKVIRELSRSWNNNNLQLIELTEILIDAGGEIYNIKNYEGKAPIDYMNNEDLKKEIDEYYKLKN